MATEGSGMRAFYIAIGAVAVVGVGVLGYMMTRPVSVEIPADVLIQVTDTAGFSGYYLGSAEALVEISEYGDYQCPFCQSFAMVQFPTIKSRLVDAGLVQARSSEIFPSRTSRSTSAGSRSSGGPHPPPPGV